MDGIVKYPKYEQQVPKNGRGAHKKNGGFLHDIGFS